MGKEFSLIGKAGDSQNFAHGIFSQPGNSLSDIADDGDFFLGNFSVIKPGRQIIAVKTGQNDPLDIFAL